VSSIWPRRKTVSVDVGGVRVGSDHPVAVQSMTNTDTADVEATVRNGTVRISPALFNTADEIERCLEVTRALA